MLFFVFFLLIIVLLLLLTNKVEYINNIYFRNALTDRRWRLLFVCAYKNISKQFCMVHQAVSVQQLRFRPSCVVPIISAMRLTFSAARILRTTDTCGHARDTSSQLLAF